MRTMASPPIDWDKDGPLAVMHAQTDYFSSVEEVKDDFLDRYCSARCCIGTHRVDRVYFWGIRPPLTPIVGTNKQ